MEFNYDISDEDILLIPYWHLLDILYNKIGLRDDDPLGTSHDFNVGRRQNDVIINITLALDWHQNDVMLI